VGRRSSLAGCSHPGTSCLAALLLLACEAGLIGDPTAGNGPNGSEPDGAGAADGISGASGGSGGSGADGALDCQKLQAGATPLRRLTRSQYLHAVTDLLGDGVVQRAGVIRDALPTDEQNGAFESNTRTAVVELSLEQYRDAAERLGAAAVPELDRLLACDRATTGDGACADQFIASFGERVLRRPLDASERTEYRALFDSFGASDFERGARVLVQAMLQSPDFLYQVEVGEPAATQTTTPAVLALTGPELASRLALFLWNSTPDEALLTAARAGSLQEPGRLETEARRMLDDPRTERAVADFHVHWLGLTGLAKASKDPALFPEFTPALAADMLAETQRFAVEVVLHGDGRLHTLLTQPSAYPSAALAEVYGVQAPSRSGAEVALDETERAGLLTQASFLAAHAHANQTSPVARGKVIRANLLCSPPPPPPPEVNAVAPDPAPGLTTRERFAVHTENASCAGCHALFEPIGFGFEPFDAIGRFRATEEGHPVDATGSLLQTDDIDGDFDGPLELSERLAGSDQVRGCVAEQWFLYAMARSPNAADRCSYDALYASFAASDYDVRALLLAIASSDAFRYREVF
jgi:hypothetical protein